VLGFFGCLLIVSFEVKTQKMENRTKMKKKEVTKIVRTSPVWKSCNSISQISTAGSALKKIIKKKSKKNYQTLAIFLLIEK
jgi:hypothetical protein